MPRNGAGVYAPPGADFPAVPTTLIQSALYNDLITDMSTALSASIASDGQTTVTANIPMAGFKFTGLAAGTANGHSVRYEQLSAGYAHICEFRMTLQTALPVTTADVTAAALLYVTPYKGNRIALYDGANWNIRSSGEMLIGTGAVASQMLDLFCYDNGGTPTLEALAWTNDTTRSISIVFQDGVAVKGGDSTRRYLGSYRTTAATQFEDSAAKRYVWNYNNRVRRHMRVIDATITWNYSSATVRQANAAAANQLDFIVGIGEDMISAEVRGQAQSTNAGDSMFVGIGLDSTTTVVTGALWGQATQFALVGPTACFASFKTYPSAGRHTLTWLEWLVGAGTVTWSGSGTIFKSGIHGEIWG